MIYSDGGFPDESAHNRRACPTRANVNIETLRYYERRKLLPAPARTESNYRQYSADAIKIVRFIKRAQDLGFTLNEIEELLSVRSLPEAQCADIQKVAQEKIVDIDAKILSLQGIRRALSDLLGECPGKVPVGQCPILESIETEAKGNNES